MEPITVLSCFDGMSCGHIALERVGIPVKKYYASEIDKYAITITQKNYPDTIQLGSITEWQSWDIEKPDLIIGGSPCQGFSFAGKQLNFDDPRSKLFFTFADILKHYRPKWFLLENVVMAPESNAIISEILGTLYPESIKQPELFRAGRLDPIQINSALVSAQNRERLYWTNIPGIEQPKDKRILLKTIIENDKTNCLTSVQKDRVLIKTIPHGYIKEKEKIKDKYPSLCAQNPDSKHLIRETKHKFQQLGDNIAWRKLTPLECERLQTVPDNYTEGVSNAQRYKMLGNGWTVDVIAHIFSYLQ